MVPETRALGSQPAGKNIQSPQGFLTSFEMTAWLALLCMKFLKIKKHYILDALVEMTSQAKCDCLIPAG
jgi:hypothetical protein